MTTATVKNAKAIYKTFRAEVKEVDSEAGIVHALIPMSTANRDRDNEIIEPKAFSKTLAQYMKRPVLLASHNYMDLRSQIGEFQKLKVIDDGLMADGLHYYIGQGNDQADWGFNLASKGMAAFSVGFIPLKWEKIDEENESEWGNRKFTEVELLEISQVVVPSNREAIQGVRGKTFNDPVTTALLDEIEKDLPNETVTKPEETETWIRIPVKAEEGKHEGHRIRNIEVSADKGIRALYCGECKVITTYLFSKDEKYGWTMASAQDWVDEHSKNYELIEVTTDTDVEPQFSIRALLPGLEAVKGAISYASAHANGTPKDETGEWDAGKEVREADVDDLKVMCAWVGDDPDLKTSYKLPHHRAGGSHVVVWRAVAACGAVIMGGRGGVDIPDSDMAGLKAHLAKHYAEFDKEPPWEKQVSQEQLQDELDFIVSVLKTAGMNIDTKQAAWFVVREVLRLTGDDIPDDILTKVGAVLNAKNKERLHQIRQLAQEVLDSAGTAEESDKALEPPELQPDPVAEAKQRAQDIAEVASLVYARLTGKRIR